jgi:4-amino-4-deoxy-L-arabinose transferase-like glycosyltransferase
MWKDEFLVLWTNQVPGLDNFVRIQAHYPISLDPILYQALAHLGIQTFGASAFAIRFPSLLGFLLMQVCLLIYVRRIAGEWAGLIALAFPTLTPALRYAIDGRPYGVLLGLTGIVMVTWQAAARRESKRTGVLIALGLAIALALNTHYFGVLLLIPLLAAEASRTLQRRKFDLPVLASVAAGSLGILFVLPFMRGASEFRAHIWDPFVEPVRILGAYVMMLPFSSHPAVLLVETLAGLILCGFLLQHLRTSMARHEEFFLLVLTALPIFGWMVARFITHTFEPRYSIPALAGFSGVVAVALHRLAFARLRRPHAVVAACLLLEIAIGVIHIVRERTATNEVLSRLILSPEAKAALQARPNQPIYIQDPELFARASYYAPDIAMRSRLALVYSRDLELRIVQIDTNGLSAIHMTHFCDFRIVPFEALSGQPGDHLFVLQHEDASDGWIRSALAADNATVTPQGEAFGGTLAVVHF